MCGGSEVDLSEVDLSEVDLSVRHRVSYNKNTSDASITVNIMC